MGKVKVAAFTVSLDGFGAGPNQSLEHPMGTGTEGLHDWMVTTKMFHQMIGKEGGSLGTDHEIADKSMKNMGAWIMGRNMFTADRGLWTDNGWQGWWGDTPPYHVPVFVLTHYPKEPLEMKGGTTFHFITEGIHTALKEAQKVANGKNIRIGGGASTVRQYLQAGLIDELQLTFSPVFLGSGEPLLTGINLPALGFNNIQTIQGEKALHVILTKNR